MRSKLFHTRYSRLFLIFIIIYGIYLWNHGFIQGSVKSSLIYRVNSQTEFDISFDKATYFPLYGTTVHDVKIFNNKGKVILSSKKARFKTNPLSFLKDNKIVLTHVYLDKVKGSFILPEVEAKKNLPEEEFKAQNEKLNLTEDLAPLGIFKIHDYLPSNVYLNKIHIKDSEIKIKSKNRKRWIHDVVKIDSFESNLRDFENIPFSGKIYLNSKSLHINASGKADIVNNNFQMNGRTSFVWIPAWIQRYITKDGFKIHSLYGNFDFDLETLEDLEGEKSIKVDKSSKNLNFDLSFNKIRSKGKTEIKSEVILLPHKKKIKLQKIDLNVSSVEVLNLTDDFKQISDVNGSVKIKPDLINLNPIHLKWENTDITLNGSIQKNKDLISEIYFTHKLNRISVVEKWLPELIGEYIDISSVKGKFVLDGKLKGPLKDHNKSIESLNLNIKNAVIYPKDFRTPLTNVNGTLELDKEKLTIKELKSNWSESHLSSKGTIGRKDPHISSIKINQISNHLNHWRDFFPQYFDKALRVESLKGDLELRVSIEGPISKLRQNLKSASLSIKNGTLSPDFLKKPLTNILGTILMEDQIIKTDDLTFFLDEDKIHFDGAFERDSNKLSKISISHPSVEASLSYKQDPKNIQISSLNVASGESSLELEGVISKNESWESDLKGMGFIDTKDLVLTWKDVWPNLEKLNIKGNIGNNFTARGPLKKPKQMFVETKSFSESLRLFDKLTLDDIEADILYEGGRYHLTYSRARFYEGEIRTTGIFDTNVAPSPYFGVHAFFNQANLRKLISEFEKNKKPKNKKIKLSGHLDMDFSAQGLWNKPETVTGQGTFQALGRSLWNTPKFRELRQILFLTIEGIDDLTFHLANGSFSIQNERIYTQDTLLSSHLIDIHFRGHMTFKNELDFLIRPKFSPTLLDETYQLGGLAPQLMDLAQGKITQYRLYGSLDEPHMQPLN